MKVSTGTMKVDTIGTDILSVDMKKKSRPRRNTSATSWHSRVSTLEKQAAVMRGLQVAQRWSESRATRVEELRAQVQAGTYKVDSRAIAESMLQNQTHFLEEEDWD